MSKQSGSKLFNKYFILICFVAFSLNITQNMLNSYVPIFLTELGKSTGFAGFLGIPYAVCAIVMRFLGGYWADRHSRRSVLIFGCFLFGITALLFGLIPAAAALILFRGLHGFAFSAGQLASSTVNADVTPPEKTTLGIGVYWVASAISLGVSGYMVTACSSGGRSLPVFIVCAAFSVLGGIFAVFCNYEKEVPVHTKKEESSVSYKGILRFIEPAVYRPAVLMFLLGFANCCATLYLLLYGQTSGFSNAGLAFVVSTIAMIIGNLSSSKLQERIGARNTLAIAFAFTFLAFLVNGLCGTYSSYLLCGTAMGFVQGICMPVLYYLSICDMPIHRRGVSGGTIYVALDLGVGIGSSLWGILIDTAGFSTSFIVAGSVFFITLILLFLFYPLRRKEGR